MTDLGFEARRTADPHCTTRNATSRLLGGTTSRETATLTDRRPTRGTLVRATSGVTHITRSCYQPWPGTGWLVETVCGKRWATTLLEQTTDGSEPCAKCWEAM